MKRLFNYKKGNVCYIGATGLTVKFVQKNILRHIKENTLIGMNGWIAHSLIPDMYILERPSLKGLESEDVKLIRFGLQIKQKAYANVPIIKKDFEGQDGIEYPIPISLFDNVIKCKTWLIAGADRAEIFYNLQDKTKKIQKDFLNNLMPKRRGTAVFAIILAFLLGFKDIRLLGVDMTTNVHFYDDADLPRLDGGCHSCENAKIGCPISQVILGVNDALLKPNKVRLTAFMPSSAFCGEIGDFSK